MLEQKQNNVYPRKDQVVPGNKSWKVNQGIQTPPNIPVPAKKKQDMPAL